MELQYLTATIALVARCITQMRMVIFGLPPNGSHIIGKDCDT